MSNNERDARLSNRGKSEERADRAEGERTNTENRQVNDQDRLEQYRRNFAAERLPRIPDIEGYHTCWLTTTNPQDPVYRRINIGYTLLKLEEVPGLPLTPVTSGEYAGCIMIGNDLIAAKIALDLYEIYMTEEHHTKPLDEEGKLRDTITNLQQEADAKKARLIVDEGSAQLGKGAPKPKFEGVGRR